MGQISKEAKIKKFLGYLFPVVIIGLFLFIMDSAPVAKKPLDNKHDISITLSKVEKDLVKGNWNKASSDVKSLKASLNKSFKVLQFSVERDEMIRMLTNLDRIEGFIKVKDKKSAIGELYEAKGHWRELGK